MPRELTFGGHGEYVTKPDDIRPALERAKKAVAEGKPALVCVVTDHSARATTAAFTKLLDLNGSGLRGRRGSWV